MEEELKRLIRNIPDFPKQGVQFKDITPLLQNGPAFKRAIDAMAAHYSSSGANVIVSIEARGFIIGAALAYSMGKSFVPLRKPGKLPFTSVRAELEKEYGKDAIEMHIDALKAGDKVLIIDDVLATGGTLNAAIKLVETAGASVEGIGVLTELSFLHGRANIKGKQGDYKIFSLLKY
jgi:adenine phosphoribosyltransferase